MSLWSLRAVRPIAVSLSLLTAALAHAQNPGPTADETQKTQEGVLAVERHWGRAEFGGDVAYLDQMLLPEYRTVNADGVAHVKADLLAHARRNQGRPEALRQYEAAVKAHRIGTTVMVNGDLAILSAYDLTLGPQKGVVSSDVFLYRDGRWRAVYSQHSNAGKH